MPMCSVVGFHQRTAPGAANRVVGMLRATAHRGPDGVGVADLERHETAEDPEHAELGLGGAWAIGHARLAITGVRGTQPMRDCGHRFVVAVNGEIWNHRELRLELKDGHRMAQDSDCDVIPHLIEASQEGGSGLAAAASAAAERLDGEFAFAVMDGTTTVLVRDLLGTKPLYYAVGPDHVAFASERKALWRVGLEATAVPPRSAVVLRPGPDPGIVVVRPSVPQGEPLDDRASALEAYRRALSSAIRKRVRGVGRVGIVFSGGVDSVMVAAMARDAGARPVCYVCGSPDAPDVAAARDAANTMGLELKVVTLSAERILEDLPGVLVAVEDRNQLHVETAFPLYEVARAARADGVRVLLTGQGADELFGGYAWYPAVLLKEGADGLRARMDEDRDRLSVETLEREDKLAMAHAVELRVPFLDPEVVAVAARVPVAFMVDGPEDAVGKRLHRELAESCGVPASIAWRRKAAAQHGSGTRALLMEAAAALGAATVHRDYDPAASVGGRVGSSQRYGHAFLPNDERWAMDPGLQWVLDRLALEAGAVSPRSRRDLETYLACFASSPGTAPRAQGP